MNDELGCPDSPRSGSVMSMGSAMSGKEMPKHNLPPELCSDLVEVFNAFDESGDGSIDAKELK